MKKKRTLGVIFLTAWFAVIVVGMASLMLSHVFAMPVPSDERRLVEALQQWRRSSDKPFAVHVIYQNCSCTDLLVEELFARGPRDGWEEVIAFVDAPRARKQLAEAHAFASVSLDSKQLKEALGIEAAPVLVVLDSDNQLAYVGGYFQTPATIDPQDAAILRGLERHNSLKLLPIYGCAVSAELQSQTDPLGIKY